MSDKGCERCQNRIGHGPVEDALCVLRFAVHDEAQSVAAALDKPPAPAAVTDLLAHLGTVYDDTLSRLRATRVVLELGWRPTVGSSSPTEGQ